ncbi:KAP family NTPase [Pseudidiomarina sp. GXY010]|uniref:KAP family NTPase n=2 Tax=Pseudidiomarina fusca TaxID=2965078 RepID=A0ABU3L0P7_9GAMM|nr:KAP family NTPase [Pseudidiomarina sp. GXY010]
MYKFINSSSGEGLTIGLEGFWGTGKSQVICLLNSKFKEESKTLFYIFDAWAHEGNPLRLAFLSGLIGAARKRLIGRKNDKAQDVDEILEEQGENLAGSITTTKYETVKDFV